MARLEHTYNNLTGGKWSWGNLHAHTTRSDGDRPLQEVVDAYARLGHTFLMISDHDIYTSASDFRSIDNCGTVLIPGNGITAKGPHILHVGAAACVDPDANRQKVIDRVSASGGLPLFNHHPEWQSDFNHCPQQLLEPCQSYVGLEIHNGAVSRRPGSPYATDRWDMLLSQGRRVWGFANDDSHRASDDGRGWNVAYTKEETVEGIVDALRRGRFYSCTGVVIEHITVEGLHVEIETSNAARIVALRDGAQRFAVVDGASISVDTPVDASYVRFECWGTGESFAWTQPFFVTDPGLRVILDANRPPYG